MEKRFYLVNLITQKGQKDGTEKFWQQQQHQPDSKSGSPLRVVLAGSEVENMMRGLFQTQKASFVQPVLVGNRARTITLLEKLGLEKEPYTMVDTAPGLNITQTAQAAIDIVNIGEGDILMCGNIGTRQFLMPVLSKENNLRTDRIMSHVSLVSLPEYPKLLALSDMTVVINPSLQQKKAIIRNTADALKAFGYENPKLALFSFVEEVTFHMKDTVETQRLVMEQTRSPFADCQLWSPIAYDLILSKEAARLKITNMICAVAVLMVSLYQIFQLQTPR